MKNFYSFSLKAFLCLLFLPLSIHAQLVIDQSVTPQELVADYLVGSGLDVSNVTFNYEPGTLLNNQIAAFSGSSAFLEFDEGIVMATSDVQILTGGYGMVDTWFAGDLDLQQIGNIPSVYDCAILEFDFVPDFEYLSVGYVFASKEYPSYTCSQYNDVFGFFVSGPGISGPYTNDAVNIAVIPYTDIPVGINSINSGSPSGSDPANCLAVNPNFVQDSIYFVSNYPMLPGDIQFPGMTTNLYANYILQPGETYHIKLAIADAMDSGIDSAVLLEAASFSSFPLTSSDDIELPPVMVKVFPNPAGNEVSVEITTQQSEDLILRMIDASGKTVLPVTQRINVRQTHLQQLDISSLSQGTYFLEVTDSESGTRYISQIHKTR